MRHELQFLSPLSGRDENGSEIETWVASQKVWCNIEYKQAGSDEMSVGARIQSFTAAIVTLRYLDGIDAKMRMYADGYEFDILTVLPDLRKSYLTLEVEIDQPTTLQAWSTDDGYYYMDSDGNYLILENPLAVLANTTGISWTDSTGQIWTPQ